jgi:DNA-binding MarR family transcriptional regulator
MIAAVQTSPSAPVGQTKPETDPEARVVADQLGALLRRLFLDPRADHLGAIEDKRLGLTQVRALFILAGRETPITAGELAGRVGLSPAAMSRSLETLVKRRLVTRRESSSDRRVRLVEIAARGEAIVEELVALRRAGLERFVAELEPEQRTQLSAALAAISPAEDGE